MKERHHRGVTDGRRLLDSDGMAPCTFREIWNLAVGLQACSREMNPTTQGGGKSKSESNVGWDTYAPTV